MDVPTGGTAGAATWAVVYPIDVVKTRIQTLPDSAPPEEKRLWTAVRALANVLISPCNIASHTAARARNFCVLAPVVAWLLFADALAGMLPLHVCWWRALTLSTCSAHRCLTRRRAQSTKSTAQDISSAVWACACYVPSSSTSLSSPYTRFCPGNSIINSVLNPHIAILEYHGSPCTRVPECRYIRKGLLNKNIFFVATLGLVTPQFVAAWWTLCGALQPLLLAVSARALLPSTSDLSSRKHAFIRRYSLCTRGPARTRQSSGLINTDAITRLATAAARNEISWHCPRSAAQTPAAVLAHRQTTLGPPCLGIP
jgi:hypothetical protein